jgi:arsenate reductase-like glutaredoxin family protein
MAFCSKFMAAIRKVMDQVGPKLDEIIDKITKVTKTIKDIVGSPAVEILIKLIPQGSEIQKWLIIALNTVAGITSTADDFYEKLKAWLDSLPSEEAKNALLAKLASVAARVADTEDGSAPKKEKVYDTAVQARILADTPPDRLVA